MCTGIHTKHRWEQQPTSEERVQREERSKRERSEAWKWLAASLWSTLDRSQQNRRQTDQTLQCFAHQQLEGASQKPMQKPTHVLRITHSYKGTFTFTKHGTSHTKHTTPQHQRYCMSFNTPRIASSSTTNLTPVLTRVAHINNTQQRRANFVFILFRFFSLTYNGSAHSTSSLTSQ